MPMRQGRPGPELDLVDAALKAGLLPPSQKPLAIFLEPKLPVGYPDIVAVEYCSVVPQISNSPFSVTQLRLLHHLSARKAWALDDLYSRFAERRSNLARDIRFLEQLGLLSVKDDHLRPVGLERVFGVQQIVAIEAKIKDWKRAYWQASANTWFSSSSYVLLPAKAATPQAINAFQASSLGLIIFDGSVCKVAVEPASRQLPVSYGSWLFNTWALKEV